MNHLTSREKASPNRCDAIFAPSTRSTVRTRVASSDWRRLSQEGDERNRLKKMLKGMVHDKRNGKNKFKIVVRCKKRDTSDMPS